MGRDQHDAIEPASQLGLNVLQLPSLVGEAVPANCEAPRSDPFQILDQRCDGRAIVGMQDVPALDHCPVGRGRLCCRVPFDMAAEVLGLDPRVQDLPLLRSEGNRGRGHPRLCTGMVVERVDQGGGGHELQVVPVLSTAEVVVLDGAARCNRDDKALFRGRQDAPRVGRCLEEVCGISVERQEAAAQLAVIAQQIQVARERFALGTKSVDPEPEIVEPRRHRRGRDRVDRRTGVPCDMQRQQRQAAKLGPPILVGMDLRNRDADITQRGLVLQHGQRKPWMRRHQETRLHRVRPLGRVLADEQHAVWCARLRRRLLKDPR